MLPTYDEQPRRVYQYDAAAARQLGDSAKNFTIFETEILSKYTSLPSDWGWFEIGLYDCQFYGLLTRFTDPLFRSLTSVLRKNVTVFRTDGYDKFVAAGDKMYNTHNMQDALLYARAGSYVRDFLEHVPKARERVVQLAAEDLRGRSLAFGVPVIAANAVLAIASGQPRDAKTLAKAYVEKFEQLSGQVF